MGKFLQMIRSIYLCIVNEEDIDRRTQLLMKENDRHQEYLNLLNSFSDEELNNMSYWDLVEKGLTEYSDMGA